MLQFLKFGVLEGINIGSAYCVLCVPDPIPNLKRKSMFVKTFQICVYYCMKKYRLEIMYDDEKDEVESIKETLDTSSRVELPENMTYIDKCITPFFDKDPNKYDELMLISIDSGFVIGDA